MGTSGQRGPRTSPQLTSVEICAGAGGQAEGLHQAGFEHLALVEWDRHAVETLQANVGQWPGWTAEKIDRLKPMDVKDFLKSEEFEELKLRSDDLSLLAGGVPCPPFSLAGAQLGRDDERDLFPEALRIIEQLKPQAIMLENVRGILEPAHVFIDYRRWVVEELDRLGYDVPEIDSSWSAEKQDRKMRQVWRRLDAINFGVPQLRPRAVLVAIRKDIADKNGKFVWPKRIEGGFASVRETLDPSMLERCQAFWNKNVRGNTVRGGNQPTGERIYKAWLTAATKAESNGTHGVAPTLVGGSRKHGGADLGPSRAKKAWALMGVDATGVANDPEDCVPERDLFREDGPMLTVHQASLLQGFPEDWKFCGGKTARYRQVGNAFPPPVAEAVGRAIAAVLQPEQREKLLKGYEMDDETAAEEDSAPYQTTAFEASALSQLRTSSDDRGGDLIGAGS